LHHLASRRLHRIERHAELVAAHLEEHRAFAALGHRRHPAVFAALQLLDPDHLGAEVTQQGAAKRPGDVSAEIEDAYSFQHARHRTLALAQSKNMLGFRNTASTRQPSSVHASWRLPALRQT